MTETDKCTETKCDYCTDNQCGYERIMGVKRPCRAGRKCDFNPTRYPPPLKEIDERGWGQTEREQLEAEDRRRMKLYQSGKTDIEIGQACGISADAIRKWRNKHGLGKNQVVA